MYYNDKIGSLQDIFGTQDVGVERDFIRVKDVRYPVIDDVIILSDPACHTPHVKSRLKSAAQAGPGAAEFAEDIQFTFGEEWQKYDKILPEHEKEFGEYFDLVDTEKLSGARACDLGCGNGRWSLFLSGKCREVVLVDFSDAVFVARKNLAASKNCLFFMGDLKKLPFRDGFADLLFCLGVLHHLPTSCLQEVRSLKRYAPSLLIFLYYSLDNRPFYFRTILSLVTGVRSLVCRVRSPLFRSAFTAFGTYGVYLPLVFLGGILKPLNMASRVPLYDAYHDKSAERIRQDVYDRFFTRIEQRVSRKEIMALRDTFSEVTVSDRIPYHHFLCRS